MVQQRLQQWLQQMVMPGIDRGRQAVQYMHA